VIESGTISQHISSVAIFIVLFIFFSEGAITAHALLGIGLCLTLMGYVYWQVTSNGESNAVSVIKGAVLFMSTLLLLSPILRTLTEDYSDDTIWALTTIFFLANLLLHDYGGSETAGLKQYCACHSLSPEEELGCQPFFFLSQGEPCP